MAQIVVTVSPTGETKIDALGFKGSACEKATEKLQVVLGGAGNAGNKKRKPDFFAAISPTMKARNK